jgi:hypothetical protein
MTPHGALEVHELIADLEIYANGVGEGNIIVEEANLTRSRLQRRRTHRCWLCCKPSSIRSPPVSRTRRIRAGRAIQDEAGHADVDHLYMVFFGRTSQ